MSHFTRPAPTRARRLRRWGAVLLLALAAAAPAEDGVTDTEVAIGQCAALDGPAAGLGTGVNKGLRASFDELNAKGGVAGRRLRLVAIDDGYDPQRCLDGTLRLIEDDKVFALAGYVGTPTAKKVAPLLEETQVPVVGLFTGAMFLRQPVQRQVFNIRASYNDETDALIEHLTKVQRAARVAVFYQNDAFGRSGLSGTEKALQKRGMQVVAKGSFERNTLEVAEGLARIAEAKPDAVVMVGPYRPVAAFTTQARAAGLTAALGTISFVGTENLIKELGPAADGIVISQVVPPPTEAAVPLVRDFQAALRSSFPDASPTYVSLEGYVYGRVLALALERAGRDLRRERLVEALEGLTSADLGGLQVSFGKTNHQASNQVFLTKVVAGKAQTIAAGATATDTH